MGIGRFLQDQSSQPQFPRVAPRRLGLEQAMNEHETCRASGVQIPGSDVFHHPGCGHVRGNRWLRRPAEVAVIAMCCIERWMEDAR